MRNVNSVSPSRANRPGLNSTTFQPMPRSAIRLAASGLARKSASRHSAKGGSATPWQAHNSSIRSMRLSTNERFTGRKPAPVGPSARRILPWRDARAKPGVRSAPDLLAALRLLRPLDALEHQAARFLGVAPADDLDPLVGLEILGV